MYDILSNCQAVVSGIKCSWAAFNKPSGFPACSVLTMCILTIVYFCNFNCSRRIQLLLHYKLRETPKSLCTKNAQKAFLVLGHRLEILSNEHAQNRRRTVIKIR